MLLAGNLLRDGPSPHVAPAWIQWVRAPNAPAAVDADNGDVPVVIEEEEEEWVPYLQPRRKRGRGQPEPDDDDDDVGGDIHGDGACVEHGDSSASDTPEEPAVFPYPVGTCVARDFGVIGVFRGVVHQHYDDDPDLCQVRYTDGDTEDMDKDEVSYAIDLYKREFVLEEVD